MIESLNFILKVNVYIVIFKDSVFVVKEVLFSVLVMFKFKFDMKFLFI